MSQLATFLENVRGDSRITAYSTLQLKQAVIMKILHSLGWDAFDLNKVQADHLVAGTTIDYALQTPSNGMIFLHLVMPLDESTHDTQDKILKLAAAENVRIAVLTDGVRWSFFSPHQRGTFNDKEFAHLNLLEQEPDDTEQVLKHFLTYRIAVSGTAFARAEKICANRMKKKSSNISAAQWQAWTSILQQFGDVFTELIAVEATRKGASVSLEDAQKFFAKFTLLTSSEGAQAKKMKYDGFSIAAAQAWAELMRQLEVLFVELMIIEIEKAHDFKPEKETVLQFLHNADTLHTQAALQANSKRSRAEA
ncbi:MAG: hypothetical protein EAZ92_09375 [Candidatus Kapaibacterium sp.]|nr:MAG: hypothetical protein EAZ92_09375 [Candidatus Kapabacteria bacterium]